MVRQEIKRHFLIEARSDPIISCIFDRLTGPNALRSPDHSPTSCGNAATGDFPQPMQALAIGLDFAANWFHSHREKTLWHHTTRGG